MTLTFKKATKKRVNLRIAITGPTGSGKTFSALSVASHLNKPIALIDTEHGSASLYSDRFDFDVLELQEYKPRNYIDALYAAAAERYPVVIIDSLSHAWFGKGGILDQMDKKKRKGGNSFTDWSDLTPQQNELVEAILTYPGHVIVTMRSKMAYELQKNDKGKMEPVKVGLSPVQRAGLEYEFDIIMDMDGAIGWISKTRCAALHDQRYVEPGRQLADALLSWIHDDEHDGRPAEPAPRRRSHPPAQGQGERVEDRETIHSETKTENTSRRRPTPAGLAPDYVLQLGDYGASKDTAGLTAGEALEWQNFAVELSRKDAKAGKAPEGRALELVKLAYRLQRERHRADLERITETTGGDRDDLQHLCHEAGVRLSAQEQALDHAGLLAALSRPRIKKLLAELDKPAAAPAGEVVTDDPEDTHRRNTIATELARLSRGDDRHAVLRNWADRGGLVLNLDRRRSIANVIDDLLPDELDAVERGWAEWADEQRG